MLDTNTFIHSNHNELIFQTGEVQEGGKEHQTTVFLHVATWKSYPLDIYYEQNLNFQKN